MYKWLYSIHKKLNLTELSVSYYYTLVHAESKLSNLRLHVLPINFRFTYTSKQSPYTVIVHWTWGTNNPGDNGDHWNSMCHSTCDFQYPLSKKQVSSKAYLYTRNEVHVQIIYPLKFTCRNVKATSPWLNVIILIGIIFRLPVILYDGTALSANHYDGLKGNDFTPLCYVSHEQLCLFEWHCGTYPKAWSWWGYPNTLNFIIELTELINWIGLITDTRYSNNLTSIIKLSIANCQLNMCCLAH